MGVLKRYGLLFMGLLIAAPVFSQKPTKPVKSSYTKHRYNHNATHVPRSKARIICPVFHVSEYPYQAIGVKIGDPFAITYKIYPTKNFSFDLDFGKSASGLYSRYYREQFGSYLETDTLAVDASIKYLTHIVKSDWMGEAKLAYHVSVDKIAPGLQVYAGLGMQIRSTQLQYDYLYTDPFNEKIRQFERSRFTQGVQGVIGIEYAYFSLPISAFIEVEMYNDIRSDPGWHHPQGGIGIRYVLRGP